METGTEIPVKFTEGAIRELKNIRAQSPSDNAAYLRVGVKGGGCSGLSYVLGFDQKLADDLEFEVEGIPLVMNKAHGIYLSGMQVDFAQGLNSRGFVFENPNASSSCGCGSSFAV